MGRENVLSGKSNSSTILPASDVGNGKRETKGFLYHVKQIAKGAALLGAGVLAYFGISKLMGDDSDVSESAQGSSKRAGVAGNIIARESERLSLSTDNANSLLSITDSLHDSLTSDQIQSTARRLLLSEKNEGDLGLSYQKKTSSLLSSPTASDTSARRSVSSRRAIITTDVGGNEFQVNTYTTAKQLSSSAAGLIDGGFVVTWQSWGQDASLSNGIYGQRYNTIGDKVGSEFRVNTYVMNHQQYPSVAPLTNGGFVVMWGGAGLGDGACIYGQCYDAIGNTAGSAFQVNTYTTNGQANSSVANLTDGGFVVTWRSWGQDGDIYGIYGRRYDATCSAVGAEFLINTYTTSTQNFPIVTGLTDGGFVVTWYSFGQDGDNWGVYGQRYNATCNAVDFEFQVNTFTTNLQAYASVAGLTGGGFVVTWHSTSQDGDINGIYGQRYNSTGSAVDPEFQVNTYTASHQSDPSIASLTDGGFVVIWMSIGQDGGSYGIYGQRYNAAGSAVGSEFQANMYTINPQIYPAVAGLTNGGFVVTWDSDWQDGHEEGIYGRMSAPYIINNALTINEGETVILNTTFLQSNAMGALDSSLNFTITNIQYGIFDKFSSSGIPISTFTQEDVINGQIRFTHDDSEIAPSYDVKVSDANFETSYQPATITYIPANDQIPVLETNQLTIGEGVTLVLNSTMLSATDADTDDSTLIFLVINIQQGYFDKTTNPGVPVISFFQQEITDGQIRFVHDGGEVTPSYQVKVSDGAFETSYQAATIIYIPMNDETPVLVANQLTVEEGANVVLNSTMLMAEDVDTDDATLIFTVTNIQRGYFDKATSPGVPITSFTQQEITDSQIRFVHDGGEMAPSYEIRVSDGEFETEYSAATINYIPVNDQVPVLVNNQLTVNEGTTVIVNSLMLSATDADTDDTTLTFIVTSIQYGYFDRAASSGVAINSFIQQEIIDEQVRFVHDGGEMAPSYEVKVGDGEFETSYQAATITFVSVNDHLPQLGNNKLIINDGGRVALDNTLLSATDFDTDDAALIFIVNDVLHGFFEKITQNKFISNFTQQEITSKDIWFVHDNSHLTPSYEVKVSDGRFETDYYPANITFTAINPVTRFPFEAVIGAVAGVCIAGAGLAITTTVVCYLVKRARAKVVPVANQEQVLMDANFQLSPLMSKYNIHASEVSILSTIGHGGQAVVYKARWEGQDVAYKVMQISNPDNVDEFEKEAKIMLESNHPNIVRVYRVCVKPTTIGLVMELMELGTLKGVLQGDIVELTWESKWNIAYDLASVLKFLHANDIVHRDIKTDNVLLYRDAGLVRAKMADFGMSQVSKGEDRSVTMGIGTYKYMAPEMMMSIDGKFSERDADIYSLGMVYVALANDTEPYAGKKFDGMDILIPSQVAEGTLRQEIHADRCPAAFFKLANQCRVVNPYDRHPAETIVTLLDFAKDDIVGFKPEGDGAVPKDTDQPQNVNEVDSEVVYEDSPSTTSYSVVY